MTRGMVLRTAATLLMLASVSTMKAPQWGWDDDFLEPQSSTGETELFRRTSPLLPDQDRWESLKSTAVSQRSILFLGDSNNASTVGDLMSQKLARSTPAEGNTGSAERRSDRSTEHEHLLYTTHEVHDYPGHQEHANTTEEVMLINADREIGESGKQEKDEGLTKTGATDVRVTGASDEAASHGPNTASEEKSEEDDHEKAGPETVVVLPDDTTNLEPTEINELDGPDAGDNATEFPSEVTEAIDQTEDNDAATALPGVTTAGQGDTQGASTEGSEPLPTEDPESKESDVQSAITDDPETEPTRDQAATASAHASTEDLDAGETRQAPKLSPQNPHSTPFPEPDSLASLPLPLTDKNSRPSLGSATTTTTTTVTIDRRLDDTSGELTRLLQDASRSTTISVTSPDFTNGTFTAQLHGGQNPWLQRYAPFFYPENPLPVTAGALERRQAPAPELRRLRIEHLVLVPPSSYPDEVLRTVHDAKLRALPRPQEEVHVHLGQSEAQRRPTVQELARGAEYTGAENVREVDGKGGARETSRVHLKLPEGSGGVLRPGGVHGKAAPFGRAPDAIHQRLTHGKQNEAVLNQPDSELSPERPNRPVDLTGFSQPRPEDILSDQPLGLHGMNQEANFGSPSAEQGSGGVYAAPKPKDILSTTDNGQPASQGDFDHRLPAHVTPFSVGFSAAKPKDVLRGGEPNNEHITGDLLRPQNSTFPKLPPTTQSSSSGHSSPIESSSFDHTSPISPSSSSGYSSPKPRDVVLADTSGRLVSSDQSGYTLNNDILPSREPTKDSVFASPKPHDVIPLSESLRYSAARATAAGVPQALRNEYGKPKLSSLVGQTRGNVPPATSGRKTTQAVVSELAMKQVAPPELGVGPEGYRRPKLVDLLRSSVSGERTQGPGSEGKDGYGTPKPSHVLVLGGLQGATGGKRTGKLLVMSGGRTIPTKTQPEEFVPNRGQQGGFTRPKPEDVILASGEFVGILKHPATQVDFKPGSLSDDANTFLSAATPTNRDTTIRQILTNPALDARENSVYYIPSASSPTPKPKRLSEPLTPTVSRFTPSSIYDILASPQPRGLPEGPVGDSGASQRPNGEPSLESPLYADAEWRPNLSPFAPPAHGEGVQREGRTLAETADGEEGDEDRWVWPRTTRTTTVTGRVLFRDT